MRLLLIPAVALVATSAPAQFVGRLSDGSGPAASRNPTNAPGWARDLGDAYRRIDKGHDSGQLSRRETRRLKRQAGHVADLGEWYQQGGLSDAESRELETRALVLRDQVDARRLEVGGAGKK